MKRFLGVALALVLALGIPVAALAQQASPGAATTQTGSTGLAAQSCLSANGTSSAQQTITVPAPGGSNSIYFDYINAALFTTAGNTTSATAVTVTTTNISGTPSWPAPNGAANSGTAAALPGAVTSVPGLTGVLAIPIKSLAGTAPTIVGPTAQASTFQFLTACWHVAP